MHLRTVFAHPRAFLVRTVGFAFVWVVLVGPDPASWTIGGPFVVAATLASLRLSEPRDRKLSLIRLAGFVPYFLRESLRGGLDVAARVLVPRLRVQPGNQEYSVRLKSPEARLIFIDSISLLPGTLSADLLGDRLTVHALDVRTDVEGDLIALERRIAAVFGESLEPSPDTAKAHRSPAPPEART
ncbi:Na+/H+ antiporter subunit E [Thiocapsa bogorovii]|uniref:MnhE n=1 Tax=Thiocapsa roseopersicina TaxID=1058 RepID=A0A1Z2RRH3_THIRO|nr:Na+/H+ antiporter subunit E [Thiocapsa bogorovii]ASA46426.1 MnhE [Thiocapsa roseopersicina]UHD16609.1 Na+/H+ antiporter subunit E [Thiocapsa bogorovii]